MFRLLIALFFTCSAYSAEYEFSYNLFTIHTFSKYKDYKNKVDAEGIIMTNPIFSLRRDDVRIFVGQDSAGGPMYGAYHRWNITTNLYFVAGGYFFDSSYWEYNSPIAIGEFMPLGAFEYTFKHEDLFLNTLSNGQLILVNFGFRF